MNNLATSRRGIKLEKRIIIRSKLIGIKPTMWDSKNKKMFTEIPSEHFFIPINGF